MSLILFFTAPLVLTSLTRMASQTSVRPHAESRSLTCARRSWTPVTPVLTPSSTAIWAFRQLTSLTEIYTSTTSPATNISPRAAFVILLWPVSAMRQGAPRRIIAMTAGWAPCPSNSDPPLVSTKTAPQSLRRWLGAALLMPTPHPPQHYMGKQPLLSGTLWLRLRPRRRMPQRPQPQLRKWPLLKRWCRLSILCWK